MDAFPLTYPIVSSKNSHRPSAAARGRHLTVRSAERVTLV